MNAGSRLHARRPAWLALALIAAACGACGPRDLQTPAALVGRWDGHVAWRDATTPLSIAIAPEGDSLAVRFFAPALGIDSLDAGRLSFDSPRVHFAVPDSAGAVAFDGWHRRGLIVGALSMPELGERNASRLPQLSLKRRVPPAHKAPWPESLSVAPPMPREREASLGGWLRALASR
jgi:hypothetical protein